MPGDEEAENELAPRERARQRHRDRKRQTRMVVDNAGVRRVLESLSRRRNAGRDQAPDSERQ